MVSSRTTSVAPQPRGARVIAGIDWNTAMMRSVMRIWQGDGTPGGSGSGMRSEIGIVQDFVDQRDALVGGGRPRTRQRHARGCRRGMSDLAEGKRKEGKAEKRLHGAGLEGECGFCGRNARAAAKHDSVARNWKGGKAMAFDVVVIGLGAMGSAALYHLAKRGVRVVGIERFEPGHDRGSSHGLTRIIRLGYFEHPSYVPLVRRAYELWRELEAASGEKLLTVTGIAEMGLPDSVLVAGTLASSRLHDLPHEVLDARALMQRYPQFRLPADFVGVIQPDGGFLEPEKAIHAHLDARQGRRRGNPHRRKGLGHRADRRRRARDDGARHDRSRHGDPRRRRLGVDAVAQGRAAAARHPAGADLGRAERAGAVHAGPVSGLHDRKRRRHPLRLSAA